MSALLPCRWREINIDHSLRCHSNKYIAPPNSVSAEFCGTCYYRDHESADKPFAASCNLRLYERRVHSQYGEDGIIAEILRRTQTRGLAVEIGAHFEYGNCYYLAEQNYPVLFVERDGNRLHKLAGRINGPLVSYKQAHITMENANLVVPPETAILSIDIDGNDYWIWKALACKPDVVIIEFNQLHPPPLRKGVPYDPNFCWDETNYFGVSLSAMDDLGKSKGYTLVATDSMQCNAYFVQSRFADRFEPATPKQLWFPPKWAFAASARQMEDLAPPGKTANGVRINKDHFSFRPHTLDDWIFDEVVLRNEYRLPDRMDGALVLDIGAHIGCFTYACACRGAAEVWCVEAEPGNCAILRQNLSALPIPGLHSVILGAAWRNDEQITTLRISNGGFNTGGGRISVDAGSETPVYPFDELVKLATGRGRRRISLLKLDCEGSEFPILYTSRQLALIDSICGEYHLAVSKHPAFRVEKHQNDLADLRRRLEDEGFSVEMNAPDPATGLGHFWATRRTRGKDEG